MVLRCQQPLLSKLPRVHSGLWKFGDVIPARSATGVNGELLALVLIVFAGGVVSLSTLVTSRNGKVRSSEFEMN